MTKQLLLPNLDSGKKINHYSGMKVELEPRSFEFTLLDARVDLGASVIKKVSLISLGEARGHGCFIDKKTLLQVFNCAIEMGSLKVKADHGSGIFSTIGYVDGFSLEADKVTGDMHVYESEEEREKIFEIADKNPTHLGLSLEFLGDNEMVGGKEFARCEELFTVALVSDPAANKSLFSKKEVAKSTEYTKKDSNMKTKTNLEDGGENKTPTAEERLSALEATVSKMAEAVEGIVSSKDKGTDPKATDPNAEPKTQGDDAELADAEKGQSGAELEDDDKKEDDKDKAEMARLSAEVKRLAAAIGFKNLPAAGTAQDSAKVAEKDFSKIVEEKAKELGDKNKAMLWAIKNHPAEYAAWRPVTKKI
jgi:hypothetical protein